MVKIIDLYGIINNEIIKVMIIFLKWNFKFVNVNEVNMVVIIVVIVVMFEIKIVFKKYWRKGVFWKIFV